ncbi:hypothetical protein [Kitasatospora sp. NBC_01302]|uniref:hypothetical protein n=1 Tax=Kitasatospora sp. NBC_01302 TaxID=2903575 RepID=UPI002E151B28|nr:hypothetical protein OG294_34660 [Kitasatospora sp. NBC_01302]
MPSRASKITRVALATAIALGGAVSTAVIAQPAAYAATTSSVDGQITRSEVLSRAQYWVNQGVPYSQSVYSSDGSGSTYRSDCSGYVSMAWHLSSSLTTQTLRSVSTQLSGFDALKPGDMLDRYDNGNYNIHVVLFAGWTDSTHTSANVYTESTPGTQAHLDTYTLDYLNSNGYVPWRYNNIVDDPTVPSAAVNTVHLVDLTPDGGLHNTEGNYSGGGWTSWNDMGASSIKDVTSASTGSTNRVFAISSTNQIWEKDGNYATGQWSGWFQPISDGHTFTAISASSSGNTVHLAAIGTDGQMYNADGAFPNGGWTSWSAHGGTNLKHIASASTSDNVNHIFVVDSGNQLREIDASYATGSWGSWGTPAGGFTGQDVTAAAFGNTVHLDTIGMDGNLYNTEGNYGGSGWGTWSNMGGSGLKRLTSATSAATNVNHIFAINSNNRLTEIDADYNTHSWNTWAEPAGGADSIGLTADFTN